MESLGEEVLRRNMLWFHLPIVDVSIPDARFEQGDHLSGHWHDLVRLDDAGYARAAFDDRVLANEIAEFKGKFFRAKDSKGNPIDYPAAVPGTLQLVPDAEALKALEADYKKMADDGILLGDAEPFADLMKRRADLERRANAKAKDA